MMVMITLQFPGNATMVCRDWAVGLDEVEFSRPSRCIE